MPPAACVGDQVLQEGPHCHGPHPPSGNPIPHPPLPLAIMPPGSPTVKIGGKPAARSTDQTKICTLPGCVPGGPGMIAKGSSTVKINNLDAARIGDMTSHTACTAPVPAPTGKILPPGCPTVIIGG